jgi:hypothetical protein
MTVELIYKTTSLAAIEWWKKAEDEAELARRLRNEYMDKQTALYGPTPGGTYESAPTKDRGLMVSRHIVLGLASGHNEQPPANSGWRLDSKERFWKPKMATRAGKERASELKTLTGYNLRGHVDEIGVPGMAVAGMRLYSAGLEFDTASGVLYQTWGSGRCAEECVKVQALHPNTAWEEVPRSEWYAREEAKAAAQEQTA